MEGEIYKYHQQRCQLKVLTQVSLYSAEIYTLPAQRDMCAKHTN